MTRMMKPKFKASENFYNKTFYRNYEWIEYPVIKIEIGRHRL